VQWDGEEATRPSRLLTTVHPLQPFATAYLALDGGRALPAWDGRAVALARQLATPVAARMPERIFSDAQPAAAWSLDLEGLIRLWQDPAAAWCRSRLGVAPHRVEGGAGDDEPFGLDGLERYLLVDHLLEAADRAGTLDRAMADGRLPLGQLGAAERQRLQRDLAGIDQAFAAHRALDPLNLSVQGTDWRLDGVLDPAPAGNVLRQAHAGAAVNERSRLALAIRLLVWNAWQVEHGEQPGAGEVVARSEREQLAAHGADAGQRLAELIKLSRTALAEPLPFFPRTAWKLHGRRDAPIADLLELARAEPWSAGRFTQSGESEQPAVALAWRGREALNEDSVRLMLRVWELLLPAPPPAPPPAVKAKPAKRSRA